MASCPDSVGCPMAERIVKLEDWKKQSEDFHKHTEQFQQDSTERSIRTEEKVKTIDQNVTKLVSWHDEEQTKPKRRFDMIVDNLWVLVLGAFAGYILGQLGLG